MKKFIGYFIIILGLLVTIGLSTYTPIKGIPAGIIGAIISTSGLILLD